jgi:hypothetical protein
MMSLFNQMICIILISFQNQIYITLPTDFTIKQMLFKQQTPFL